MKRPRGVKGRDYGQWHGSEAARMQTNRPSRPVTTAAERDLWPTG